jgi:hypothetical protein
MTGGNVCAYDRTYAYKDCLTVVTDNLSGKKLFYHFNDYGNCISVNDQLGYACFAKYTDSNPINHPETISKMQRRGGELPEWSQHADGRHLDE